MTIVVNMESILALFIYQYSHIPLADPGLGAPGAPPLKSAKYTIFNSKSNNIRS